MIYANLRCFFLKTKPAGKMRERTFQYGTNWNGNGASYSSGSPVYGTKTYGFWRKRGVGYGLLQYNGLCCTNPCLPTWWAKKSVGYKGYGLSRVWIMRSQLHYVAAKNGWRCWIEMDPSLFTYVGTWPWQAIAVRPPEHPSGRKLKCTNDQPYSQFNPVAFLVYILIGKLSTTLWHRSSISSTMPNVNTMDTTYGALFIGLILSAM